MNLFAFLIRTFGVSFSVGIRMMPVMGVTLYSIYMLVSALANHPLAIFAIAVILYLPLALFLFLCAVRAGLASMGETNAPDFRKLATATFRLMRFHFMIGNLIFTLVGLGGAALVVRVAVPELAELVLALRSLPDLMQNPDFIPLFAQIPIVILVTGPVAVAFAVGLVGTSLGGTAAWAAEKGPEHDLIWGVGRQSDFLLATCAIVCVLPVLGLIVHLGGATVSLLAVFTLSATGYLVMAIYALWAVCAVAASIAVAYVKTMGDIRMEKRLMRQKIMGDAMASRDVRALRLARQARHSIPGE